jgi:PST family polysaccharide transporter
MLARLEVAEIAAQSVVAAGVALAAHSAWAFPVSLFCRYGLGATVLATKRRAEPAIEATSGAEKNNLRRLLAFGAPVQTITALSVLQNAINPIVVGATAGLPAAGLISWGVSVASLPTIALQGLPALLFALSAEGRRRSHYNVALLRTGLRLTLTAACALAVFTAAVLPLVVIHVFGGKWLAAITPTIYLLSASTMMWFNSLLTSQCYAYGQVGGRLRLAFVECIAQWVFAGAGAYMFGATGYAIGLVIAQLILLTALIVMIRQNTAIDLPISDVLPTVISSLLIGCLCVLIHEHLPGAQTGAQAVAVCVAMLTLYVVALFACQRRTLREDVQHLSAMVKGQAA